MHVRTSLLQNVHCGILVRCIVRFLKYRTIVLINNYLATSFIMNKQQAIIYINDQFTHWMIHGTRSKNKKQKHEIFQTWRLPLAIHIDGITYLVYSWSNAFLFSFLWLIKCRITVITWYLKRFIPFLVPLRSIFRLFSFRTFAFPQPFMRSVWFACSNTASISRMGFQIGEVMRPLKQILLNGDASLKWVPSYHTTSCDNTPHGLWTDLLTLSAHWSRSY